MAAIITDDFKKRVLTDIYSDFLDSENKFYLGIGKPIVWNDSDIPVTPLNTEREIRNAKLNTISVKLIKDASRVAKRYNWSRGTIYNTYNDDVREEDNNNYYVITDENEVFVCIANGKDNLGNPQPSRIKPTYADRDTPFLLEDGYIWKFLFTVGTLESLKFMGANYFPIRVIDTETGTDSDKSSGYELKQYYIQQIATPGEILGYEVIEGGTEYDNTVELQIVGDGLVEAKATANVNNGTITHVDVAFEDENNVDSDNLNLAFGQGYSYASVNVIPNNIRSESAIDAEIRPIFGPKDGLGANSYDDLRSNAIMFYTNADGDVNGDWIVGNDFRQVTLMNIPYINDQEGITLKSFEVEYDNEFNPFTVDNKIFSETSGAEAYVVKTEETVEETTNKIINTIWYLQNETTGFNNFQVEDEVSELKGTGNGTITKLNDTPDINVMDAEVLYIDNRYPVMRTINQEEDFKIIIKI
jgi:hypothetical protein